MLIRMTSFLTLFSHFFSNPIRTFEKRSRKKGFSKRASVHQDDTSCLQLFVFYIVIHCKASTEHVIKSTTRSEKGQLQHQKINQLQFNASLSDVKVKQSFQGGGKEGEEERKERNKLRRQNEGVCVACVCLRWQVASA